MQTYHASIQRYAFYYFDSFILTEFLLVLSFPIVESHNSKHNAIPGAKTKKKRESC